MSRNTTALLIITVVALGLRLVGLGDEPLWLDEAVSVLDTRGESVWSEVRAEERQPPLFFWLLGFWGADDANAFRLRLLSVLLSIGAVPLTGLLARRWVSSTGALGAAAFVAVAQPHFFFSQQLRPYGACSTVAVLTVWLLVRWIEKPEKGRLIAYAISCVAAAYLSYHLGLLLFVQFVALGYLAIRGRAPWLGMAVPGVVALVSIPLISLASGQLDVERPAWLLAPNQLSPYQIFLHLAVGVEVLRGLPLFLALAPAGLALLLLVRTRGMERKGLPLGALYGLWAVPIALAFLISVAFMPILKDGSRYLAYVGPFFAITLVAGLETLSPRWRWALGGVWIALSLAVCVHTVQTPQRRAWDEVAARIQEQGQEGDFIVSLFRRSDQTLQVHLGEGYVIDVAEGDYFSGPFRERVKQFPSFWFLSQGTAKTSLETALKRQFESEATVFGESPLDLRLVHFRLKTTP